MIDFSDGIVLHGQPLVPREHGNANQELLHAICYAPACMPHVDAGLGFALANAVYCCECLRLLFESVAHAVGAHEPELPMPAPAPDVQAPASTPGLTKFSDPPTCAKCGSHDADVKFFPRDDTATIESLSCRCQRCGYAWSAEPLDAG